MRVRARARFLAGVVAAVAVLAALAGPVAAHGDHDARPVARNLSAGPYVISVWQVYPEEGSDMAPHLIVLTEGGVIGLEVQVAVNGTPMEMRRSTTSSNGWETIAGVAEGDVVLVTVSDGTQAFPSEPVAIPPPPTAMLPMAQLIYVSIFLTAGTAVWVAMRTARAWRKPVAKAEPVLTTI